MEALQKEDDSPFKLGYIQLASHCLALESPLFRAAAAAHTPPASDFLLVILCRPTLGLRVYGSGFRV